MGTELNNLYLKKLESSFFFCLGLVPAHHLSATLLNEKWEEHWPEQQVLINKWNLPDDTPFNTDQKNKNGSFGFCFGCMKDGKCFDIPQCYIIQCFFQQLYNFVRWRTDTKPVRTKNPQILLTHYINNSAKKCSKKSKWKHTILKVYSDHYYKSKIQGLVNEELKNDAEFASLSQKKHHAYQLSVYQCIHANCWKNESDEVKDEIQNIFNEKHRLKDKENSGRNETETKDDNEDESNDNNNDEKTLLGHQQE